jgi:DMSO/TMAO reductase YedYZ heme-binding membrane subunit
MINNIALWYTARACGVVALLLLTASVALGILGPLGTATPNWPRFTFAGLHRNVSLLALMFLGVHVSSSVIDSYAGIGWWDAIIPFESVYRPLWLGLGAAAFDLLLALVGTSLLRPRISQRLWRSLHWTAYLCWPLAFVHSLGAGTDTGGGFVLIVALVCVATVAIAGFVRTLSVSRSA